MGKGGYHGGSTLLKPGSDWFGYSSPKPAETPEQREERKRKKAERKLNPLPTDPATQKRAAEKKAAKAAAEIAAAEKAARKAAAKEASRQKRLEKERLRRERAEKRKSDPDYIAMVERRRMSQDARMASVVIEVKSKRVINKPGSKA